MWVADVSPPFLTKREKYLNNKRNPTKKEPTILSSCLFFFAWRVASGVANGVFSPPPPVPHDFEGV